MHGNIMTSTLSDKTLESFPHRTVYRIIRKPMYQDIHCVHDMVNKNAVSVQPKFGGGNFGIIGLTLYLAAYSVLSPTVFVAPYQPGTAHFFPHTTTFPQISNIRHVFAEDEYVYQRFDIVIKALNTLLQGAYKQSFSNC